MEAEKAQAGKVKAERDEKPVQIYLSRETLRKVKAIALDEEQTIQSLLEWVIKDWLEEEFDWTDEEDDEGGDEDEDDDD